MRDQSTRLMATCGYCGKEFETFPWRVRAGEGKFCARKCQYGFARARWAESLLRRMWSRIDKTDSCWIWTGAHNDRGYGHMAVDGRHVYVHRFVWELFNGAIPDSIEILHNCPGGDNPGCCNPAHLRIGTHAENMADASAKGQMATGERSGSRRYPERLPRGERNGSKTRPERVPRGESHGEALLTEAAVRDIRGRYAAGGIFMRELAAEYCVTASAIRLIVRRERWAHVD